MTKTLPQPLTANSIEETLRSREQERRDALVASDMTALADLLTDDLVHVHTTGIVQGKAELLGHAGSFLQFHNVERGPLTIRLLSPEAAVMTGAITNTVSKRGNDQIVTVYAYVTQVWSLRRGRWQIASFHAVRTAEAVTS